jgi:hypothetical protein
LTQAADGPGVGSVAKSSVESILTLLRGKNDLTPKKVILRHVVRARLGLLSPSIVAEAIIVIVNDDGPKPEIII